MDLGAPMTKKISSGASWGRFRAPKLVLQFSKMLVLLRKSLHFWRNQGLYSKMVLRAFWCSFRAYLGGKKGGGWVYLLADQRSTYVFWSLFLCFLLFLLDMLMFFFVFFVFFCFFDTYVYVLVCFFFFFPLGGYLCRFWAYKLPLQPSKMMVSLWRSLHFWKIKVLYWKTGLGAFWHSFWLILGARGGILWAFWGS